MSILSKVNLNANNNNNNVYNRNRNIMAIDPYNI
jgi:hypothetical protein